METVRRDNLRLAEKGARVQAMAAIPARVGGLSEHSLSLNTPNLECVPVIQRRIADIPHSRLIVWHKNDRISGCIFMITKGEDGTVNELLK